MSRRALPDFMAMPPGEVLVVTDYDGTIAPIVGNPSEAHPTPQVAEHLSRLVPLVRGVAILSGRSEASLRSLIQVPGVLLLGENGIAALTPGERVRLRDFEARARAAVAGWPGVAIEVKPASLSVHFRARPEIGDELEPVLAALLGGSGLTMVANRMVFDVQSRRGTKVRTMCRLIGEFRPTGVLYAGDSRDDASVHRCLKATGIDTLCIGMESTEMPAGLFKNADLILDGPEEMAALLSRLAGSWSRSDTVSS